LEAQVIGMKSHRIYAVNRRIQLLAVGLVVFALAPASALAAGSSPTDAQYHSTLQQFAQGSGGDGGAGTASSAGGLPFTGLDVVALAVVAAGLLAAGLMLRRQRPTHTSES
jgi:hypothetical protein